MSKVFNANTMEWEERKDETPDPVKEPVKKESEEPDPEEPETPEEKPEKKEGEEDEPENPDNDDPKKKKDDAEEEEEEFDSPDKYIESTLGEKFEIKSEAELLERLEDFDKLLDENEELNKKLKEKEDAKPKFENEAEEKLFKFIKDIGYNPAKFSEGLQTYARVMSIDDNTDGRIVMEEKYILDHPELTREEAQYKFGKDYVKKFASLSRDDFDSDEQFKEAEKERKIDIKTAEAKAREVIAKKQKDFKSTPNKEDKNEPEINEEVTKGIERTTQEHDKHLKEFTELVFSPTDDEEDDYSVKFSPDQVKRIRAVCHEMIKNPASYNKKGELLGGSDPVENIKRAAYMLFGDEIVAKNYDHANNIYSIKRAEQLGETKPTRVSKTGGAGKVALSEEEQWEKQIARKKGRSRVKA